MKDYIITFEVTPPSIKIDPKNTGVKHGDKVMFKSKSGILYVDFHAGHWPFTEPQGTIVVPAGGNTQWYHVSDDAPDTDQYDVYETGHANQTVGQIDIEPAHV